MALPACLPMLLASLVLLAGCGANTQPPIRAAMAPPDETESAEGTLMALAPGEGWVVGMAVLAMRDMAPAPAMLLRVGGRFLLVNHENGARRQLRIAPVEGSAVESQGAQYYLRPFAFRMPAGRATVVGRPFTGATGYSTAVMPSGTMMTMSTTGLFFRPYPPLTLEVVAGQATYVGWIGLLERQIAFTSRETRDAACEDGVRTGGALGTAPNCGDSILFVGADAAADLPRILSRFPQLEGRAIAVAPARAAGAAPRTWPEVLAAPLTAALPLAPLR